MKCLIPLFICLLLSRFVFAVESWDSYQHFPSMKEVYHPVSTKSEKAQKLFDQGLLAIYAFNHDAAYQFFEEASKEDSELAMAYWGMALSLGENLNRPIDEKRGKKAFDLTQEAIIRLPNATENEQAYIIALAHRYSNNRYADKKKLSQAYKDAMKQVTLRFPDDLDAATLYSESIMNLRPWKLWTKDGKPEPGTAEAVRILEYVLKQNPDHLGANHYYIHVIEASPYPEKALSSAYRLYNLLPEWGHILHMPSHIFLLTGDYEGAVLANRQAADADFAYIKKHGVKSFYIVHYLSHNLFFLCRSYLWQERAELALKTAEELEAFLLPHLEEMPELEYYALAPMQVHLYTRNWEEILKIPKPKDDFLGILGFWHFARSLAFLKTGKLAEAEREKTLFFRIKEKVPKGENLGFNSAASIFSIARHLLEASFANRKGDQEREIKLLEIAASEQDALHYNEPPDWYYPVRQSLGRALYQAKELEKAEKELRKALNRLPRNGRSLFGLFETLKAQGKESYWIEREAKDALRYADKPLKMEDL